MLDHLQIPQVLVGDRLGAHDLAAVDDAAASHRQHQVGLALPGQLGPLLHLGIGGVGHDAGKLGDRLAGRLQDLGDFRIDPIFLDGAAAVGQQHIGTVGGQNAGQMGLSRPLAEIDFCGIFVDKVFHIKHSCSSRRSQEEDVVQLSLLGRTARSDTSTWSGWEMAYSTALAMTSGCSPTFL